MHFLIIFFSTNWKNIRTWKQTSR